MADCRSLKMPINHLIISNPDKSFAEFNTWLNESKKFKLMLGAIHKETEVTHFHYILFSTQQPQHFSRNVREFYLGPYKNKRILKWDHLLNTIKYIKRGASNPEDIVQPHFPPDGEIHPETREGELFTQGYQLLQLSEKLQSDISKTS
jgi:hypothetical protein